MAKAVAVYVGKRFHQRENLEFGVENGVWGFPGSQVREWFAQAEYVLFGWNFRGNVRNWDAKGSDGVTDLLLVQLGDSLYESDAPLWPDEIAAGHAKYRERVGLGAVIGATATSLAIGRPLTSEVAEGLKTHNNGHRAQLVDVDPELFTTPYEQVDLYRGGDRPTTAEVAGTNTRRAKLAARMTDARVRMAIEERSLVVAEEHLRSIGARRIQRVGKPYDLSFELRGEELHAEVKGTSGPGTKVILTPNEVTHASEHRTWLMIVRDIHTDAGEAATGGNLSIWKDWTPSSDDLTPTQYSYVVPALSDAS